MSSIDLSKISVDPKRIFGDFTFVILVVNIPSSIFFDDHNLEIYRHKDELGWRNIGFINLDDDLICIYEYDDAPVDSHTAFAIDPKLKDPSGIVKRLIKLIELTPCQILGHE